MIREPRLVIELGIVKPRVPLEFALMARAQVAAADARARAEIKRPRPPATPPPPIPAAVRTRRLGGRLAEARAARLGLPLELVGRRP